MGQRKWKEYCSSSAAWMTQEGKIAWNGDNCLMFMTIMLWIPSDLSTNSTSAAFCHALTLLLFLIFILFIQRSQEKINDKNISNKGQISKQSWTQDGKSLGGW